MTEWGEGRGKRILDFTGEEPTNFFVKGESEIGDCRILDNVSWIEAGGLSRGFANESVPKKRLNSVGTNLCSRGDIWVALWLVLLSSVNKKGIARS